MKKVKAKPGLVRRWGDMAGDCAAEGPPGISYRNKVFKRTKIHTHTLEYRNDEGVLIGLMKLLRIGQASSMGVEILSVQPRYRRRGIATELRNEAVRRWPELNLLTQEYTADGAGFANAFLSGRRP